MIGGNILPAPARLKGTCGVICAFFIFHFFFTLQRLRGLETKRNMGTARRGRWHNADWTDRSGPIIVPSSSLFG